MTDLKLKELENTYYKACIKFEEANTLYSVAPLRKDIAEKIINKAFNTRLKAYKDLEEYKIKLERK